MQCWLAIMISNDPSCNPLGGTAPPREAKKQKVCDISANLVHRVAPWFKLLMRGGLSQDSSYDRSAFSFLPGLAWAGELWQKNRADFWGQEMQAPQSKISWNWFVKAPVHHQLESTYSNALLYETKPV